MKYAYNIVLIGYIGYAVYVLSEPWHNDIERIADNVTNYLRTTYNRGQFVIEASIDTQLVMKGM